MPHPQDFQAYENTLSGAANRILTLAEEQMRHRHEMEKRSITLEETKAELVRSSLNIKHDEGKRGQQYALFLSLVVVLAGCFFAYLGYDKSGATIISLTLIGIIGAFVNNIRKEKTQQK